MCVGVLWLCAVNVWVAETAERSEKSVTGRKSGLILGDLFERPRPDYFHSEWLGPAGSDPGKLFSRGKRSGVGDRLETNSRC